MRSVLLCKVQRYIVNYTYVEYYKLFKGKESSYKTMWIDQGRGYWIKFILAFKRHFTSNSSFYDVKYDSIFISFLRALTQDNFDEVGAFLENAAKRHYEFSYTSMKLHPYLGELKIEGEISVEEIEEMKTVIIMGSVASAFLFLLPAWKNAQPGEDFNFGHFSHWFADNFEEADPLEGYIRSIIEDKSEEEIQSILGIAQLSLVRWWSCPVKTVPPLENNFVTEPCPPLLESELKNTECLNIDLKCVSDRYLMNSSELLMRYEVTKDLPSILVSQYGRKIAFMKSMWQLKSKILVYQMFQHGYPPLLPASFHRIDKSELVATNKKFLCVLPCFAIHLETFDLIFLERMNEYQKNLCDGKKFCNLNFFKAFKHDSEDTMALFSALGKNLGNYDFESESISNLRSFLLEPCVLIQLISQPVLLRQWFSAAFIAVLKLEVETVEFRHLPIPKEIEPLIRQLLVILANLKEIILFGFWYIGSVDKEKKLLRRVIDEYVFGSLHDLEFVCSESTFIMAKSLKQECYSERMRLLNLAVQLEADVFHSLSETAFILFPFFYGNFIFWDPIDFDSDIDLFPQFRLDDELEDVPSLAKGNKYHKCVPKQKPFHMNVKSGEEKKLFKLVSKCYKNSEAMFSHTFNPKYVAYLVTTYFEPCRHFSKQGCGKLVDIFFSDETQAKSFPILNGFLETLTDPIQQAILSGVQYRHIESYLESVKNKPGLLLAMNRMTAEVARKEQLVRIVAACAMILWEAPTLCENEKCPLHCVLDKDTAPLSLLNISRILKFQGEKKKEKSDMKAYMHSKFPKEWSKPVEAKSTARVYSKAPAVMADLQERIGKIIWNVAMRHYKNINIDSYPDVTAVHYLLPCYVSSLLDVVETSPTGVPNYDIKTKYLKLFLSALVEYYEKSFLKWVSKASLENCSSDLFVARYNYDLSGFVLHGFTMLNFEKESTSHSLPHLKLMFGSLNSCSEIFGTKCENRISISQSGKGLDWLYKIKPALMLAHKIKTPTGHFLSRRIYISHSEALKKVCFETFPVPLHNSFSTSVESVYFTHMIIHQILCIVGAQKNLIDQSRLKQLNIETKRFKSMMPDVFGILFLCKNNALGAAISSGNIWGLKKALCYPLFGFLSALIRENKEISMLTSFPDFESTQFKETMLKFFDRKLKTLSLFSDMQFDESKNYFSSNDDDETGTAESSPKSESSTNDVSKNEPKMSNPNLPDLLSSFESWTDSITSLESNQHDCGESGESAGQTVVIRFFGAGSTSDRRERGSKSSKNVKSISIKKPSKITPLPAQESKKKSTKSPDFQEFAGAAPNYKFSVPKQSKRANATEVIQKISPKPSTSTSPKLCNNCGKEEPSPGLFIPCKVCNEQSYPVPNFFCNTTCKTDWWDKEHSTQHAEFQIGLFDWASLLKKKEP